MVPCVLNGLAAIVAPMRCRLVFPTVYLWIVWIVCHCGFLEAATIDLEGGKSIRGEIIAERAERVVVDVGYDILLVPMSAVVSIERSPELLTGAGSEEVFEEESKALFYTGSANTPAKSITTLAQVLGEAVVQVKTPSGLGSGFFVNEAGFLITNFHVIESETEITIDVYHQVKGQLERESYRNIRIVALNRFADLALLQVEDEGAPEFRFVPLGDLEGVAVGESVFAIGSPLGLERTVTEGIVSTKTREYQGWLYLQTTTQINPGNSGGPLFNRRGEVVGVTNMKLPLGEGLGFAIPADYVKHFLRYRDAFAYDYDNPNNAYRYLPPPTAFDVAGPSGKAAESSVVE